MNICGVEITGNEAIICLLNKSDGLFSLPESNVRRLQLKKLHTQKDLLALQSTFADTMRQHNVNQIVIGDRPSGGKNMGSVYGFKIEAAIQLLAKYPVECLTNIEVKERLKLNPLPIDFSDTGLKKFQETAFLLAFASHCDS